MLRASDIPIPTPCHADWDAMRPEVARRYCDQCDKHVHDLSAMTRRQAERLLSSNATAGLCVRYLKDDFDRVAFRPEPGRLLNPKRLAAVARAARAAVLISAPLSLTACMGAMRPPPAEMATKMAAETNPAPPAAQGAPRPAQSDSSGAPDAECDDCAEGTELIAN